MNRRSEARVAEAVDRLRSEVAGADVSGIAADLVPTGNDLRSGPWIRDPIHPACQTVQNHLKYRKTQILLSSRTGPAYPSEMAEKIGVTRQILSDHLACLRGCGLVVAVPEGRRSRYELADARIAAALEDLLGLALAVDPTCCPDSDTPGCR